MTESAWVRITHGRHGAHSAHGVHRIVSGGRTTCICCAEEEVPCNIQPRYTLAIAKRTVSVAIIHLWEHFCETSTQVGTGMPTRRARRPSGRGTSPLRQSTTLRRCRGTRSASTNACTRRSTPRRAERSCGTRRPREPRWCPKGRSVPSKTGWRGTGPRPFVGEEGSVRCPSENQTRRAATKPFASRCVEDCSSAQKGACSSIGTKLRHARSPASDAWRCSGSDAPACSSVRRRRKRNDRSTVVPCHRHATDRRACLEPVHHPKK